MTVCWVSPVGHDRTRPVVIFREWKLTRNDRTLRSYVRSFSSSASGQNLNVLMTIEIGRSAFEVDDTWQASVDRTLGSYVRSLLSSASGHYLNVLMTIEIRRSTFEANDTWQASGD